MTKILHIPTGIIFTSVPTYLHLKWFFNLKDSSFDDGFDLKNNFPYQWLLCSFIVECDKIEFLDSDKKTPYHNGLSNKSAIKYLQENYSVEEFEVLDG